MNKRANLYLNIYELVSFLLAFSCIGLTLTLKDLSFKVPFIIKSTSLFIGTIFGVLFILIEIFLFLLMKPKVRALYIIYLLFDIMLSIIINTKFSFYGLIVFIIFCIFKNILRIKYVNKIYIEKSFQNYCKLFNIKIADFKKKKEVKEEIPEKQIKIKVGEASIKNKVSKKSPSKEKTIVRKRVKSN